MVVFDFSNEYTSHRRLRFVSSATAGAEGALPDTYGLSPEELVDKMNTARDAALGNAAG
jgi:hypothetical protein